MKNLSHKILGNLKKIELREIWNDEAQDFTPWLAEEKNLELLSETIKISLELEAQKCSPKFGPFFLIFYGL